MEKPIRRPLALGLTILAALVRVAPHPPNFAPVGGMSLFAGARLRGWMAYLLPLALMAVTDPIVGGYSKTTPFVYASFLINVWIGRSLRASESPWRIGSAAVLGSVQFFLLSNFAVWLFGYPHNWTGLTTCYALAIPFFGPTLVSDLLATGVLFGLHAVLSRTIYTPERLMQAS